MVEKPGIQGLCCTCNSRSACLSLSNSLKRGEPILYCELFDNSVINEHSALRDARERRKGAHSLHTPLCFKIKI